jgi:hypothetical protein
MITALKMMRTIRPASPAARLQDVHHFCERPSAATISIRDVKRLMIGDGSGWRFVSKAFDLKVRRWNAFKRQIRMMPKAELAIIIWIAENDASRCAHPA